MPEKKPGDPIRLAALAGLWLALFALIFTVGVSLEIWPSPPPGALRGADFIAGVVFLLVLLAVLLGAAFRRRE
jgi:polyferredoxin